MSKIGNFDVLKALGEQGCKSFKGFFSDNITQVSTGKDGWGRVTVAIDNETASKVMVGNPDIVFMLVVADRADFDNAKAALENGGDE